MRTKYILAFIPLLIMMLSSVTNASLNISVNVNHSSISRFQTQTITATANEKGTGFLLVIQPGVGPTWTDSLDAHPDFKNIWYTLPSYVRGWISSTIGNKIVSYNIISFSWGGGSESVTFPDDFTGINGDPSTELTGKYKVLFVYTSKEGGWCYHLERDFDCGYWFVVPEVPLGSIISVLAMVAAIPAFKFRHKIFKQK